MTNSKTTKTLTILGSTLLLIMALFHASGLFYVTGLIQQSNVESFIQEIFPVLFAHPSVQLLGLSGLGIVTLFMTHEIKKVISFIVIMVLINALFAFYLEAILPGILLVLSSALFALGGIKSPIQS